MQISSRKYSYTFLYKLYNIYIKNEIKYTLFFFLYASNMNMLIRS